MKQVYSSKFQEIYYDESKNLIKNIWISQTISLKDMQKEMQNWMAKFNQFKPKYMLTDCSKGIVIPPEMQEWINSFLFPTVTQKGILKYAVLLSEKMFSKVSVKLIFDENKIDKDSDFQQFFFDAKDETKALNWLVS